MVDCDRLHETLNNTREVLLNAQNNDGVWQGQLSSSPLATAVAVFALYQVDAEKHKTLICNGLKWLVEHQQSDGSWGDAETLDPGNLSTTLLCYSAFSAIDSKFYSTLNYYRKDSGLDYAKGRGADRRGYLRLSLSNLWQGPYVCCADFDDVCDGGCIGRRRLGLCQTAAV
ncbi:MAG: hypothetical protein ACYSUT_01750 [Planctomycetota bacterium]